MEPSACSERVHALVEKTDQLTDPGRDGYTKGHRDTKERKTAVPGSNQGRHLRGGGFKEGTKGKVRGCSADKGEVGHPRGKLLEGWIWGKGGDRR